MPTRRTSHRQRLALACLLLATLLTAQTLGLLHRVVHFGGAVSQGPSHTRAGPAAEPLQALFAQHRDNADCKLFDHVSHADGLVHIDACMSCLPPLTLDTFAHTGWHLASQAAGFLARGPPLTV
ncbi:MAG: hypothetical protein ABIR94_23380 [Rubrivivax sp.]